MLLLLKRLQFSSKMTVLVGVQSVLILACSDEYLQVLGLTQPTVLTLEWIRGLFLGFAICICSESTFDYTTKHSKWHFFS